jgi:hypothetical protein
MELRVLVIAYKSHDNGKLRREMFVNERADDLDGVG